MRGNHRCEITACPICIASTIAHIQQDAYMVSAQVDAFAAAVAKSTPPPIVSRGSRDRHPQPWRRDIGRRAR